MIEQSDSTSFAGLIRNVVFGVYKGNTLTRVGTSSGMSLAVRKDMSANPQNYKGKVCEIVGQEVLRDAIRHPRYIREVDGQLMDNGLKCTAPGCRVTIRAWTGLQEVQKLQAHMRKAHRANWNMNQALENRIVIEKQNEIDRLSKENRI